MAEFNLNDFKDEGSGSDFYKFPTGDTKLRILSPIEEVKQVVKGVYPNAELKGFLEEGQKLDSDEKVRISGWAWCNVDGEGLKIITFPYSLVSSLAKLKQSEDYFWDDFPMPYDITVHNTGEGGARYSITPARANKEVEKSVLEDLESKTPIADIIEKIREKKNETGRGYDYPENEGDPKI